LKGIDRISTSSRCPFIQRINILQNAQTMMTAHGKSSKAFASFGIAAGSEYDFELLRI